MSIRRGYYYLTDEGYDGPFETISEAKLAASARTRKLSTLGRNVEVSIHALVTLETRDRYGSWETVH